MKKMYRRLINTFKKAVEPERAGNTLSLALLGTVVCFGGIIYCLVVGKWLFAAAMVIATPCFALLTCAAAETRDEEAKRAAERLEQRKKADSCQAGEPNE